MILSLPIPPSPNDGAGHPIAQHRIKKAYQKKVWAHAISQCKPLRDPPQKVLLSADFFVHNLRDEDNLEASLKFLIDALRQKQAGSLDWRQGVYYLCGYLVDDDPEHMTLGDVTQVIDRKNKRVEVTIADIGSA